MLLNRRISRANRALVLVSAIVIGLALVTGCGSSSTPAAESTTAADTVTIAHEFGETKVPANPQRVVTAGWIDQDFVLSLGIVPVGSRGGYFDDYDDFPWVKQETGGKGVPAIDGDTINFEGIAAAKPDVIFAINETIDEKTYDRLSQIAPTVDFTSEANAHYVIGKGDPRNAIFDGLGLDTKDTVGDVSEEKLNVLDGNVLFLNGLSKDQMADVPAFQRLAVVKDGRTIYAGSDSTLSGAIAFGGPNAMLYALDLLVPQIGNALTGKPVEDLSNA